MTEYPPSTAMVNAIADTFTLLVPKADRTGPPKPLSAKNRERTLVALLAARGERSSLAIHIYWALALKVSPHDIVHTLLLTGAYAGVPAFAGALGVAKATFKLLEALPSTPPLKPKLVVPAILAAFP